MAHEAPARSKIPRKIPRSRPARSRAAGGGLVRERAAAAVRGDYFAIWDCQGWRTATNDAT